MSNTIQFQQALEYLRKNARRYDGLTEETINGTSYTLYGYWRDSHMKEWNNEVVGNYLTKEEVDALRHLWSNGLKN